MKNDKVAFWLCVFLGYLGVHWFYLGNFKKGILYFFTCGLFGIGWIIDIIRLIPHSHDTYTHQYQYGPRCHDTYTHQYQYGGNNCVQMQSVNFTSAKDWWDAHQKEYADYFHAILGYEPVKGIYKITNKITGECYIGQSKNIYKRWMQHCYKCYGNENEKFARAIRRYGLPNFTFEVVEYCDTKDALDDREMYWIKYYNSYNKGYNSTAGNK